MISRVKTPACLLLAAMVVQSCGPKTLTLPEEPVERAATCGAVAAAEGRSTTDIKAPLSLEAIGRVIHYPMLAASAGASFSSETATRVQNRMAELQDSIVESKWQDLIPACKAAFPAAAVESVELPADRFDAQLGCVEVGDFLRTSLQAQDEYMNELGEYRQLSGKLEAPVAAGMRSRASSDSAAREERRKALAAMARLGPPVMVMRQCLARFG